MSSPQKLSPPKARFILHSERLGPLPLVNHFIDRIGLESLLDRHVPSDARCAVPHARALGVLLRSIIVEREPIYRQQETVHGFASGMFGIGSEEMNHLSDDRLGRALDHLFDADRAADARLTSRLVALARRLASSPDSSFPRSLDAAELKAAYRFVDNEQVDTAGVLASHVEQTLRRMTQVPVVPAVQDATEFNLTHLGATEGLGYGIGNT
jgi:hypothetical protein